MRSLLSDAILCSLARPLTSSRKRPRVALSPPSLQDRVADWLHWLAQPVVVVAGVADGPDQLCARVASLPPTERRAVLQRVEHLRELCHRGDLDRVLDAVASVSDDEAERQLVRSLRRADERATTAVTNVASQTAAMGPSDSELDAWLSGVAVPDVATASSMERVDEDEDDDGPSGASPMATQFVRQNVYELKQTLARDELRERLEPIRKQLAANLRSGQIDWLPLLREVEAGGDVPQIVAELDAQLQKCSVEAFAALLTAFCDERAWSFSHASKSAFFEHLLGPKLCALERVAPRVLVAALQFAVAAPQHARVCVSSLLVPMLARGGAAQCELVGRILKDSVDVELCNEFLERFLGSGGAAATLTDFTFVALQGVLDKKNFRLSGAAATAVCQALAKLAPQHGASLKFASLLFRLVSKHGGDVQRHRGELQSAAEQCSGNFMGKQAATLLAKSANGTNVTV